MLVSGVSSARVGSESGGGRRRLGYLLTATALTWACAGPVPPDLVITNARVFTNDTARPWAEAIAIKGQRVVAVGTTESIAALAGPSTQAIDAGLRVVVPGFNDARVDLPLEPPTPAALAALDRAAIARGVTSLQVVAGGSMHALVVAARQATRQARWRLIRAPMDGERPKDEEPYLPPQPGERLFANGVAWTLGTVQSPRTPVAWARVPTVVRWAYGGEDPLVMSSDSDVGSWLAALGDEGLPQVWQRKRPRLDTPTPVFQRDVASLVQFGVVVAVVPPFTVRSAHSPEVSLGALIDAGIQLAAGSGGLPNPMSVLTALVDAPGVLGRALTREEAVRAMTWGSAYAEKAERDKGWLGAGTLADLAVLSDDVFTAHFARLRATTSVLTLVGGTIVYDPGVLTK